MIEKTLKEINRLKRELDGYSALEALDYIESYVNTILREPASKDLDREIGYYTTSKLLGKRNHSTGVYHLTQKDCDDIACHFAEWQKQKSAQDFLEKAEKFFNEELFTRFNGKEYCVASNKCMNLQQFIKQFKNYMKNEM